MKEINRSNWLEKDSPNKFFDIYRPRRQPELTEAEEWVEDVMRPKLLDCVPTDIHKLFEAARGMTLASLFSTWRAKDLNPFSECLTLLSDPATP